MKKRLLTIVSGVIIGLGIPVYGHHLAWHLVDPSRLDTVHISSPGDVGNGSTRATPDSLADALTNATAGDYIIGSGGTYIGKFTTTVDGTAANRIVVDCQPGERCILDGKLHISSDYITWKHWEFTDPDGDQSHTTLADSLDRVVTLNGDEITFVNNIIRNTPEQCMSAFNNGTHIVYGNLLNDCGVTYDISNGVTKWHGMYIQNHEATYGVKYIVDNIVGDVNDFMYHQYSETDNQVDGFHVEGNVWDSSSTVAPNQDGVIFGGTRDAYNLVIKNNFYFAPGNGGFNIGGGASTQVTDMSGNVVVNGAPNLFHLWGNDIGTGPGGAKPFANSIQNNIFIDYQNPNAADLTFRFAHYDVSNVRQICISGQLDSADTIDNNTYYYTGATPFYSGIGNCAALVNAGQGSSGLETSLADLTTDTTAWGDAWETSGTETDWDVTPRADTVTIIPNDYEPARGHVVVENYSGAASTNVDISSFFPVGRNYIICNADTDANCLDPFMQGNYAGGNLSFDTSSVTFGSYLAHENHSVGGGPVANKRSRGRR